MPNAMVYAAVTPICILYVLFFVSQFPYFLGGFTGELAEGFTYAEYARKGFFELCAVCCINFAVIGIMSFMAKQCSEDFYHSLNLSAWLILANGGASK